MLGFSAKTIRRDIASMPDDVRKMSLACPSDVPVMSLTEYGLQKNMVFLFPALLLMAHPVGRKKSRNPKMSLFCHCWNSFGKRTFRLQKRTSRLLNSWSRLKIFKCFCKLSRCFLCQLRRGLFSSVYLGYMKRKSDGFAVALLLCLQILSHEEADEYQSVREWVSAVQWSRASYWKLSFMPLSSSPRLASSAENVRCQGCPVGVEKSFLQEKFSQP